jgi:uroporphyrin-III C-methyltransferase / precorrin-2 dehydrogenase / sirohydrochlorin ferrochelatase
MRFLPLFFDLTRGSVVLVGGGAPAIAKLRLLRAAGANVRWYANGADAGDEMHAHHYAGTIEIFSGEPQAADLAGGLAVVSSAGKEIDERIAALARAQNIPVNIVDRPDLSTFIFPSVVDRGEVVVGISTGGASPVLARRLREKIEAVLPARVGEFAGWMRGYRERLGELRERGVSIRAFWEKVIDGPIGAAFLSGRRDKAEADLARAFDDASAQSAGSVHLVGAGPGDADLLTLRALQTLQAADVIFYDDLIGPGILDRARRDAKRVFVGKRRGAPGVGQDAINRLLLDAAQAGQTAVRLKGGDPFIFGRGGEELEFLQQHGVPVTVVPGITAALGCAAEAGLPLTFRKDATRLTFVTANTAEGADSIDWTSLADPQSTIVVYMGLSSAALVQKCLIGAGRDRATPVAVLARGTRPDAKAVVGRLEDLQTLAASAGEGPAVLVIGEAVAHSAIWNTTHTKLETAA